MSPLKVGVLLFSLMTLETSTPRPKFLVTTPTLLRYFSEKGIDVNSVSCGFGFTLFNGSHHKLKRAIYGCGINSDGQLGHQTDHLHGPISEGVQVDLVPEPRVLQIPQTSTMSPRLMSCGRAHSLVVYQDVELNRPILFSLGNNTFGQCAREIIEGEVFTSESAQVTKVAVPDDLTSIRQVECGQDHSLVLTDDGRVFSAGLGTDGQTGLGVTKCVDRLTQVRGCIEGFRIRHISSRGDTVLALTECGRLFAWGNNEYGQIWPVTDEVQVLEPVELPIYEYVGANISAFPEGFTIGKIKRVAAAGSICGVLDEHGHVLVWGFGCLGLGPQVLQTPAPALIPPALFTPALPSSDNRLVDLVPGLHHFIVQSKNGLLWSWGAPRGGLACLGLGRVSNKGVDKAVKNAQTYPVPLSLPAEAVSVACGVDHTVVLAKSFA
uniref:RCC1-like G exchanging factor-like protein n=1 Tax=Mesocestoides corti TaxID=53468 RepID=A0A5K3EY34_MESCO